jgi:hypothetical protein
MHGMMKESTSSGSYNGRRAVSETDNVGPIPTPEAYLDWLTINNIDLYDYMGATK